MAISFVGVASTTAQDDDTSFTITKPSGVASGDLMIAAVASFPGSGEGQVTATPPAGWTLHLSLHELGGDFPCQLDVMYKVAGASEPGSWGGTWSGSQIVEARICAAYRGVVGGITTEDNSVGSTTSLSTGSISNPTAGGWRFTIGAYASGTVNYEIDSNEVTERAIAGIKKSGFNEAVECGFWDSNDDIAVGSTSRTISRDAVWSAAHAVVGILGASDLSSSGTLGATIPLPVMTASGSAGIDAELDVDLLLPVVSSSGIASSPEGPLETVVTPVMDVVAGVEAAGTLDAVVPLEMNVVTETRPFGIRIVEVEAEKRRMLISYRDFTFAELGDLERFEGPIEFDIPITVSFEGTFPIRAAAELVTASAEAFGVISITQEVEVFAGHATASATAGGVSTVQTANADAAVVTAVARPITRAGGAAFVQPDAASVTSVANDVTVSEG